MGNRMDIDWGSEIRRIRRTRLLKQAALAELLNVNQATVSRWERNAMIPEPGMQRRLRDLARRAIDDEFLLRHTFEVSLGQLVLSSGERVLQAASAAYAAAHGVAQSEMPGRRTHRMYTEDGERLWQTSRQHGFYRGDVASVTLVCRAHALSGRRRNMPTKVVWTPIRLAGGEILLRGERADLPEAEFAAQIAANGGPIRIVRLDDLAS